MAGRSDLLLMTSVFEGVPYMAYEAMAMGVPVVAPSLPGTVELMEPTGGILIDPRDDVEAYVEAILAMIDDEASPPGARRRGRARMLDDFSLRQMAEGHERLYDDLLANTAPEAPVEVRQACSRPLALRHPSGPRHSTGLDRHPLLQPWPLPAEPVRQRRGAGLSGDRADHRGRRVQRSRHDWPCSPSLTVRTGPGSSTKPRTEARARPATAGSPRPGAATSCPWTPTTC